MLQHISIGVSVKIMISRSQINGTNTHQRLLYTVVVGALETVKKGMIENIEKVSKRANVTEIQKICMLGSARILRKVLSI